LQDRLLYCSEHKADIRRVGGLCETSDRQLQATRAVTMGGIYLLWVEVEVCSIHLVESPEQVFGGAINVIAS